MAKKNIETLYKQIFSVKESLQDAISSAQEVVASASEFGGEISRVITSQLNDYLIPVINKYVEDTDTPGAVAPLITFLDSVPLAMTREELNPETISPSPIDTTSPEPQTAIPTLPGAAISEKTKESYLKFIEELEEDILSDENIKDKAEEWSTDEETVEAALVQSDAKAEVEKEA